MTSLKYFKYIVIGFLIANGTVCSQDSLILLNGNTYVGVFNFEDKHRMYFEKNRKVDKIKLISFQKNEIFYLHKENQPLRMIYQNGFVSEHQMAMYVKGEQDAIANFKIGYHYLLGCALGLTGGLLDTYEFDDPKCKGYFNSSASIVSIITPFAVSVVIGFPNKKVRKLHVSDQKYLNSDYYKSGFNQV